MRAWRPCLQNVIVFFSIVDAHIVIVMVIVMVVGVDGLAVNIFSC